MATAGSLAAIKAADFKPTATVKDGISKQIEAVQKQIDKLSENETLSPKQKEEQRKLLNEQLTQLKAQLAEQKRADAKSAMAEVDASTNADTLQNYIAPNNSRQEGFTGFSMSALGGDVFFGAASQLSNLQAMNKARKGIEGQARTLTSEIAIDRSRGAGTADKEKRLSNLTNNVNILDNKLASEIETALKKPVIKEEEMSIIDQIKKDLEKNQTDKKPIIDKINDGLEETKPTVTEK